MFHAVDCIWRRLQLPPLCDVWLPAPISFLWRGRTSRAHETTGSLARQYPHQAVRNPANLTLASPLWPCVTVPRWHSQERRSMTRPGSALTGWRPASVVADFLQAVAHGDDAAACCHDRVQVQVRLQHQCQRPGIGLHPAARSLAPNCSSRSSSALGTVLTLTRKPGLVAPAGAAPRQPAVSGCYPLEHTFQNALAQNL